jgi:glycosyltransferase involved in cell wall biosynthesis
VSEDHGPYRRGQRWAEPDLDAAAQCMRRVAEDPGLCRQIGDAARLRIEERFAPGVIGQLYRRRLETLALQELIPWTLR